MLTKEGCKQRRQRFWDALPSKPDVVLIADPQHLFYFANYIHSPFVFRSNDAGAVLMLHADGRAVLVADSMVKMFCDLAFVDDVVAPVWYDGKHTAPHREALLVQTVLDQFKTTSKKRIGVELSQVPAGVLLGIIQGTEISNVDPVIHGMKRKKDADELELLNRSMRAGEAGMAAGLRNIKPGMSELEMYFLCHQAAQSAIGSQALMYGDFVTGPRTEQVGGPPSDRKVQAGELVLLDFSTIIGHYRADFANTHICAGKPSDRQRDMYLACMDAIDAGEKKLRAGTPAKDVDRAVRAVFEAKHLGEFFVTHSGHGIGLGHPEAPFIVPDSADTLLAGDVVTLEPGLYIKGVGGMRFERNYLVTETGFELMSKHKLTLDAT
jgi:Xaa-Pro aminopeptidase